MTITKTVPLNKAKADSYIGANLSSANILPYRWYKTIKSDSSKPDLIAITTLPELWFLQRKHTRIDRLKFKLTSTQLQETTLRLDSSAISIHSFRTVVIDSHNFPSEFYLKINLPTSKIIYQKHHTLCSK